MLIAPLLLALTSPCVPPGSTSPAAQAAEAGAEDEPSLEQRINLAIDRGVDFLVSDQARDGSWGEFQPRYERGSTGLVAYALRHAGLAPEHPAIQKALVYLEANPARWVYSLGCELVLLSTVPQYANTGRVEKLLAQMLAWQTPDGWAYPSGQADLSCVHYAMFGLAGAEVLGVEADRRDWERARKAVLRYVDTGDSNAPTTGSGIGFVYHARSSGARASLTAAGVAILQLTLDSAVAKVKGKARSEVQQAIDDAKDWLDSNWRVDTNVGSGAHQYYHLMAIERAAVLSEWDEVAGLPWYETGATWLLEQQKNDGGWADGSDKGADSKQHETAFAILFLRRAARGIATGVEPLASNILRAEDLGDAVHIALRGQAPVRAWVTGFGLQARSALGADALRVQRVEYLVSGEVAATVEGGGGAPWDDDQLVAFLNPAHRGPLEVRARVVLADEAGEESGKVLMSGSLSMTIDELLEPWAIDFSGLGAENLVPSGRPVTTASTSNEPDPPHKAVDGLEGTWWLSNREDETPVLRIEFGEVIKAKELWISPADGRLSKLGRFDRILEVVVTVDGVREPFVVEAGKDPLAPLFVDLGKRRRISGLEIAITRRQAATTAPGLAGFNELYLR